MGRPYVSLRRCLWGARGELSALFEYEPGPVPASIISESCSVIAPPALLDSSCGSKAELKPWTTAKCSCTAAGLARRQECREGEEEAEDRAVDEDASDDEGMGYNSAEQ